MEKRMKKLTRRALVALGLGALGLASLGGCSAGDKTRAAASGAAETVGELTVDEVEARIAKKDGSFFVFDVNPKEVFEAGHVPTAKWIEEVQASVLPADKTASLVFYCANER
jgi:hypothetical protein